MLSQEKKRARAQAEKAAKLAAKSKADDLEAYIHGQGAVYSSPGWKMQWEGCLLLLLLLLLYLHNQEIAHNYNILAHFALHTAHNQGEKEEGAVVTREEEREMSG